MTIKNPDESISDALDAANREADSAIRIIQQLLDYAFPTPLSLRKVNGLNLIRKTLSKIDIPKAIAVEIEHDDDFPSFIADSRQLEIAIYEICLNSVQAIPEAGILSIALRKKDMNWVALEFYDSGTGIKEDHLEKLFEPLFSTKAKGIGLGLPVAQTIVAAHNGVIEIRNNPEEGVTVTVLLPLHSPS